MQGSGLLQRPHLILKNSDNSDSVGFEFSDYKQLNTFQAALMGYKIVSQLYVFLSCIFAAERTSTNLEYGV